MPVGIGAWDLRTTAKKSLSGLDLQTNKFAGFAPSYHSYLHHPPLAVIKKLHRLNAWIYSLIYYYYFLPSLQNNTFTFSNASKIEKET